MMAAAAMDGIIFSANQPQCFSAESSVNCANCILMKEQLHSAVLELKSAKTTISFLREDINKATASEATNLPKPSLLFGSSGYEQAGSKWISVVHSFSKRKKTPTVTSVTTEQFYRYSNRFTPLTNLKKNQDDEVHPTSNYECSSSTNSIKKTLFNLVPVIKYLR
jgi:hypothetical protein